MRNSLQFAAEMLAFREYRIDCDRFRTARYLRSTGVILRIPEIGVRWSDLLTSIPAGDLPANDCQQCLDFAGIGGWWVGSQIGFE